MNNLKTFFWTFLVLVQFAGNAQESRGFISLQSGGDLPEDFTKLSRDIFLDDYSENIDEGIDEAFFLESRFLLDRMLLGDLMVFNEPCSDYANEVADYILSPAPKLRDELRFYILKSSIANAFSTDQGIIVITTALLASLENEAQLAFVLAHEIAHYTEKCVRHSYVYKDSVERGIDEYNSNGFESKVQQLSRYSKDHEFTADQLGIKFYLQSEYDLKEIYSAYEVLNYSRLPFGFSQFDPSFLRTDVMVLPQSIFDITPNQIIDYRDFDDYESTHPNIELRIDSAKLSLDGFESKGSLKYKVSEQKFIDMQEQVRLEQINLYISQCDYSSALFCISIMEEISKEDRFLKLSKVKALYGLVKYRNRNRLDWVLSTYGNSEGAISVINRFLADLTKVELNILAYRHIYDAYILYDEPIFESYENDMFLELALYSDLDENELKSTIYIDTSQANDQILDSAETIDIGDIEHLKGKELESLKDDSISEIKTTNSDHREVFLHALNDLVSEHEFIEEVAERKLYGSMKREVGYLLTEERAEYGFSLGLDNFVIIDPRFEKYNSKNKQLLLASEKFKISLSDLYVKDYAKLNLERALLDSKNLNRTDTQKYNDLGIIYQWLIEVIQHQGINMISSTHDGMDQVSNRNGSKYFLFSGIYSFEKLFSFRKKNYTEIRSFVLNSETDKLEFIQYNDSRINPESLKMEAFIFNTLYQLNRVPKKRP